jgi:hypothetical protein
MALRAGQISDWGVGLQIRWGGDVTAKTRRSRRKTRRNTLLATDGNQMHTDGNSHPWRKFFYVSFFASSRLCLILIVLAVVSAGRALGDDSGGVPFYYGIGTRFEPQISTLVVGMNDSAGQAVQSRDRKYVSLNVDTSLLGSAGVRRFQYQKGGLGFVGSEVSAQNVPASGGNGLTPSIAALPSQIAPPVSILDKVGMVLITPLER